MQISYIIDREIQRKQLRHAFINLEYTSSRKTINLCDLIKFTIKQWVLKRKISLEKHMCNILIFCYFH